MMAKRSNALLMTASCLSLLPRFGILAKVCEKVASDLELSSVFHRLLQFPPPLTNSYKLTIKWQKK